jgi:hypothetical protein
VHRRKKNGGLPNLAEKACCLGGKVLLGGIWLFFGCPRAASFTFKCNDMKPFNLLRMAFAGILLATVLGACLRDECGSTRTYVRFDPVYKLPAEFRKGITAEGPRSLKNPGKIYAIGQYLLINERQEGIHVVDNSDPANPRNIAFWNIPGNVDMAVRDGYLYADQYVDLLSIDVSDIQNPVLACTTQDAFRLHGFAPGLGYFVDYKQTEVTEEIGCDDDRWGRTWFAEDQAVFFDVAAVGSAQGPGSTGLPAGSGIAGSYARFGLHAQFLYTVDNSTLRTWSLGTPSCPARQDSVLVGWNIETIFPWKDRLFIGSQTGVFIFNNQNPARPVQEAMFSHASGCDPVVCDDNNAYVTIHDGTTCNGTINQLDIIDIRNLPTATLRKSYNMTKPKGLSVTNAHLFLCDDGLKIFDKSDPLNLRLLSHLKAVPTYDVIAFSDAHLLVIGEGGFYQFDVSDPAQPKQISLIPVVK